MTLHHADILSAAQFSREHIEAFNARADEFANRGRSRLLDGKLLATLLAEGFGGAAASNIRGRGPSS